MIKPLNIENFIKENELLGPVTATELFESATKNRFHDKGLFSEKFFGISGSLEYKTSYSWIELNTYVIHPFFYELLKKRIERNIVHLLSSDKFFKLDKEGFLTEDPDGETGMSFLVKNIKKIRFRKNDSEESEDIVKGFRSNIIDVMYKSIEEGTFLINKLLVIPPFYRPITVLESGETVVDSLNEIYRRILILTQHVTKSKSLLKDAMTYRMQLLLEELLDFCKTKLAKKSGLIRSLMLGKRVDFSARGVISPNANIGLHYVGIPFRMVCQLFEPFLLYGLINSPYAKNIPNEFHKEVKNFLGKEKLLDID